MIAVAAAAPDPRDPQPQDVTVMRDGADDVHTESADLLTEERRAALAYLRGRYARAVRDLRAGAPDRSGES